MSNWRTHYNRTSTNNYQDHRFRPKTRRTNRYLQTTNAEEKRLNDKFKTVPQDEIKNWDNIHRRAKEATTVAMRNDFEDYIKYLSIAFGCGKCRRHIKEYLEANPIPNDLKDRIIFKWAWQFHNAVNVRLSKSGVTLKDAYNRWY